MLGVVEIAGVAILTGAVAQVAVTVAFDVRRRVRQAQRQKVALDLFREQARIHIETARAERERHQLSWNGVRKFVVRRKTEEAARVASFYLEPHDGKPVPPFEPGQYLTFRLRVPGRDAPLVRCYSLSDSPHRRDGYRVTVKQAMPPDDAPGAPAGAASSYFCESLDEGDIVDVRAPAGHFVLDPASDRPLVLIGGGVGLTPLYAMLRAVCDAASQREVWLFYGVRNRAEHVFYEALRETAGGHANVRILTFYSRPTESCRPGEDYDHEGRLTVERIRDLLPSSNYEFYICGPPGMLADVTRDLRQWGVPEADIRFEAFGAASVRRKAEPATEASTEAIEVVFAVSGKTCRWTAAAGSILDFAEDQGVAIESGCRAGSCGSCVTAVREGEVRYLVDPGTELDRGSCYTCIAVPKGRLVLEA